MAPSATETQSPDTFSTTKLGLTLPENAVHRLQNAGIDTDAYPTRPKKPEYLDEVFAVRNEFREHVDPGTRASPNKSALLSACSSVTDLTAHIGTELVGIQLATLNDQQLDDLGLLIAERSVVFLRDQQLTPQDQKRVGAHYGEVEVHPQVPQVPGVPGVTVMWPDLAGKERAAAGRAPGFRNPGGASGWHTDLVHERQPAGVTHLHNDTVPKVGGDTLWSSGYSAYEKLSPEFRKFLDGKKAVYRSAHQYHERGRETDGPKFVEREHPIVRVHPATGWKSLWVNRGMTVRIVGLDKGESDLILNYLYDIYERNIDIQVRFRWTEGASALWDNRITQHIASWDYEGNEPRHGTRVTSLAEQPFFDANAPTRREALGLDKKTEEAHKEQEGFTTNQ